MTSTASRFTADGEHAASRPSIRRFVLEHKPASLVVLVVLVLMVGSAVPAVFTAGSWKVSDATSCSAWSSANPTQQAAYSRLYLQRHGSAANGATSPAGVEAAVDRGCVQAFAYDEADQVTVLQAIKKQY